jgi:aminoglycoside phosphotransferase (APT) family kinase protein
VEGVPGEPGGSPGGSGGLGAGLRQLTEPGLIGVGRASKVYDLGDGTVLRRTSAPEDLDREALVMRHAHAREYPVPRVVELRPDGLVLERVDGPTMLADLRRRVWLLQRHVRTLVDLQRRLHAIDAPPDLASAGEGAKLLHLDFHPDNVLLSPTGPVVIDWTNARRGDPPLDVAMTWVIAATSGGLLGRALTALYLRDQDLERVRAALPLAAARRLADPNVTEDERARVRALVRRAGAGHRSDMQTEE